MFGEDILSGSSQQYIRKDVGNRSCLDSNFFENFFEVFNLF